MPHPDEGALHALLDGELEAGEAARLEAHLTACGECRARLAEARSLRDEAFSLVEELDAPPALVYDAAGALDPARPEFDPLGPEPMLVGAGSAPQPGARPAPSLRPDPDRSPARPRWMAGLAWAATVVLAVTAGYVIGIDRTGGRTESRAREEALGGPRGVRPPSDEFDRRVVPPGEPGPERAVAAPAQPGPKPAAAPPSESVAVGRVLANAAPRDTVQVVVPIAPQEPRSPVPAKVGPEPATRERAERPAAADRVQELVVQGAADGPTLAAIRILGGSLRLVEGLVPARIELADSLVRVHYATAVGGFVLEEWREGDRIQTRVRAGPGTPRDSILAWSRRIR